MKPRAIACVSLAASGACVSGAAFTQSQHARTLNTEADVEEVVVTATRREEKLHDVPLSIMALPPAQLTNNDDGVEYNPPRAYGVHASFSF